MAPAGDEPENGAMGARSVPWGVTAASETQLRRTPMVLQTGDRCKRSNSPYFVENVSS